MDTAQPPILEPSPSTPPTPPFIVLEADGGLCTFPTAKAATVHDYGREAPPLAFFDAEGRRLRSVEGASDLEVDNQEDESERVRERVRDMLEAARPRLEELAERDPLVAPAIIAFLAKLSDFQRREAELSFSEFARALATLLDPPRSHPDVLLTPGSWGHYGTSLHHR